jgi:acyl carrier protein
MVDSIVGIMARAFEVPKESITVNSSQSNIENWDSLHHIKMIVLLERELNIEIPDEDVTNMVSYKIIETIINECKKL